MQDQSFGLTGLGQAPRSHLLEVGRRSEPQDTLGLEMYTPVVGPRFDARPQFSPDMDRNGRQNPQHDGLFDVGREPQREHQRDPSHHRLRPGHPPKGGQQSEPDQRRHRRNDDRRQDRPWQRRQDLGKGQEQEHRQARKSTAPFRTSTRQVVQAAPGKGPSDRKPSEEARGHVGGALADELTVRAPRHSLLGGIKARDGRRLGKANQGDHESREDQHREPHPRESDVETWKTHWDITHGGARIGGHDRKRHTHDCRDEHPWNQRVYPSPPHDHAHGQSAQEDRRALPSAWMRQRPECALEHPLRRHLHAGRTGKLRPDDEDRGSRRETVQHGPGHHVGDPACPECTHHHSSDSHDQSQERRKLHILHRPRCGHGNQCPQRQESGQGTGACLQVG